MDADEIARMRMRNVGLWQPHATSAAEALVHLTASQAQDYLPATWSLAQRCTTVPRHEDVASSHDAGRLVRTHLLRPTWHFVAPDDLGWLLTATAPRVHQANAYMYRQTAVDAPLMSQVRTVLESRLAGADATRMELQATLAAVGIEAAGMRLGYVLMYAELEGWICSGRRRGNQQTYALVAERVPKFGAWNPEEALARLASRYFTTRGPATVKDLAIWASLTLTEARRAVTAVADELEHLEADGRTYLVGASARTTSDAARSSAPRVDLVQAYDEVVMGYSESKDVLTGGQVIVEQPRTTYLHAVLLDGRLAGHWRYQRDAKGRPAVIETQLHRPLTSDEAAAMAAEVDRFATFAGGHVEWRE